MNELIETTKAELINRVKWAFWWPFIISWCLINWKVILVLFSLNSETINEKIDYISNLFRLDFSNQVSIYNPFSGDILFNGINMFTWWNFHVIWKIIIFPFLLSFIVVWLIPYLSRWYLRKQIDNKNKENEEYKKWLKSEIEVRDKELELQEKNEKIEKKEEYEWQKEYEKFIAAYPDGIMVLCNFLYGEDLWVIRYENKERNITAQELAYLSAYNLMEEYDERQYRITEKWKYFLQIGKLEWDELSLKDISF